MSMELVQVRLPEKLILVINSFVKNGFYASKSDFIRDAVRRLTLLEKQIGSISNTGNSVKEIKEIRKKLSKEKFDINNINKL